MINTFNIIKKYFEISLEENLNKNNKINEFKNIKKNIIVQSTKDEFGDYQSNVCLVLSKIYGKNPRI